MERFKSSTAPRYCPSISLLATIECDAVVRTVSDHKTLHSLLEPHIPTTSPPDVNLISSCPTPPAWLDATRTLEQTLRETTNRPSALVAAYSQKLEHVTAVALHDFFSEPILTVLAAWVGDSNLIPAISSLSSTPDAHILLVTRTTRQDDAAKTQAVATVAGVYGEENVHLITLNDDGPQSPPSIAAKLDSLARAALSTKIAVVSKAADRARRAARPTFRSWFSTSAPRTFDEPVCDRRLSLSGRAPPRFPPDSLESTTRRLADLYMMSGRYTEAADTYRLLQSDFRGLAGAAIVHEASALEMTALALALTDGSKQAIGSALEKAIAAYCSSGRRELAVRAALRTVDFCMEAGFPDSAAGVIIRAMSAILPEKGVASPAGSSFVEGALAVLSSACCVAYRALRRHRRASLYAFLSASRFSKLKLLATAACMAREIDDRALLRASVRQEIELTLGAAEAAEERNARAVSHFIGILAQAHSKTDVEIQGSAIKGLLAASTGAHEVMSKRWDSGASFPLVEEEVTNIVSNDSSGGEDWYTLENDVLEDADYFSALSQNENTKRERRVDVVAAELRQRREKGDDNTGGSIEMKIRRMRDLAEARRKKLRQRSLLNRGAVAGERISMHVSLRNPLQFPVFVRSFSAVVSIDGRIYHGKQEQPNGTANGGELENHEAQEEDVLFFPTENVTLMPCSTRQVQLELSVRKPCKVRFIGVLWSFTIGMGGASPKLPSSYTPGFCLLGRRGRRLNDTRRQRSSEIPLYAEDTTLTIQIAPSAPRMKASFSFRDENNVEVNLENVTMRSGEIREGKLRLENQGQMPLEEVSFRIGTPETLFIDVTPEKEQAENGKVVFATDHHDDPVEQKELTVAGRATLNLGPGEVQELPIWLHAAVQNSTFGYRSDLHGNTKKTNVRVGETGQIEDASAPGLARLVLAYGTHKIRVARLEGRMRIQPSLRVSPRFLRPADSTVLHSLGTDLVGVLLGIEVEHAGSTQNEAVSLEVNNMSVTSRSGWKLKTLQTPSNLKDSSSDDICPSQSVLRINETGTFFAFVVRKHDELCKNGRDATLLSWQTHRENLSLYEPDDASEEKSEKNEASDMTVRASTRFTVCSQLSSTVSKAHQQEMVYVSVGWKSGDGTFGELNIPAINPLRWMAESELMKPKISGSHNEESPDLIIPRVALTESKDGERSDPVVVTVDHPTSIEHKFNPDEDEVDPCDGLPAPIPAVVPVDVHVKNVSAELIDIMFQAQSMGGIADGDRGRVWSGEVAKTLHAVSPNATRVIHLTAVLLRPGEYNVANFNIAYQSTALTTKIQLRQEIHMEPSYVVVTAEGTRRWSKYDFNSVDMITQGMEVVMNRESMSSPGKTLLPSKVQAPAQRDDFRTLAEPKRTVRIEVGRKDSTGRSTPVPVPADRASRETPRRASSGQGLGRVTSKSPVDRTRGKVVSKPSPDDAYWNDADTDESE